MSGPAAPRSATGPKGGEAVPAHLRLGAVLRSPHSERRGFVGFAPRSVPIALNREPDRRETRLIEGRAGRVRLASAGYGGVSLRVESTRIEVDGATVALLDGPLMGLLTSMVAAIDPMDDAQTWKVAFGDSFDEPSMVA